MRDSELFPQRYTYEGGSKEGQNWKRKEGNKCSASSKWTWSKPSGLTFRNKKCLINGVARAGWKLEFPSSDNAEVMHRVLFFFSWVKIKKKAKYLTFLYKISNNISKFSFFSQSVIKAYFCESLQYLSCSHPGAGLSSGRCSSSDAAG